MKPVLAWVWVGLLPVRIDRYDDRETALIEATWCMTHRARIGKAEPFRVRLIDLETQTCFLDLDFDGDGTHECTGLYCVRCGCSYDDGCEMEDGFVCHWANDGDFPLCSACEDKLAEVRGRGEEEA